MFFHQPLLLPLHKMLSSLSLTSVCNFLLIGSSFNFSLLNFLPTQLWAAMETQYVMQTLGITSPNVCMPPFNTLSWF